MKARLVILLLFPALATVAASAKEREGQTALTQITVQTGVEGCQVELDAQAEGKSTADGILTLKDVDPGDHYVHVNCPGQPARAYFVSVHAGETLVIQKGQEASEQASTTTPAAPVGETKIHLQELLREAIQLRAKGRIPEAVSKIREAMQLDPENSDLHREMGITFLLDRDWKRARVEMLEAIRHDPTDADAHNGLGYALEKMGDLDAALKEYRLATHLDPDDPTYRTHYFDALSKLASEKPKKK